MKSEEQTSNNQNEERIELDLHNLYMQLKDGNFYRPSAAKLTAMEDEKEAGFVLAVCDYFLQCKQAEEIKNGVF